MKRLLTAVACAVLLADTGRVRSADRAPDDDLRLLRACEQETVIYLQQLKGMRHTKDVKLELDRLGKGGLIAPPIRHWLGGEVGRLPGATFTPTITSIVGITEPGSVIVDFVLKPAEAQREFQAAQLGAVPVVFRGIPTNSYVTYRSCSPARVGLIASKGGVPIQVILPATVEVMGKNGDGMMVLQAFDLEAWAKKVRARIEE